MMKLILSLCDYSGVWTQPYVDAGYDVVRVDLGHEAVVTQHNANLWHVGFDLTSDQCGPLLAAFGEPYGVLAAPPCCCFCRPGARWWPRMDERGETAKAIDLFRACLSLCQKATGWWALENPPGWHQKLIPELGKPSWQYQPWWYGDAWKKQTYIWGTARRPVQTCFDPPPAYTYRQPNGRIVGHVGKWSSSWKREREKTPEGFARAFFESNK